MTLRRSVRLILCQEPSVFKCFTAQQFHLFSAAPFGVNLPPLLVGPLTPDMRAQNDFLRLAFFEPQLERRWFLGDGGLEVCTRFTLEFGSALGIQSAFLAVAVWVVAMKGLRFFAFENALTNALSIPNGSVAESRTASLGPKSKGNLGRFMASCSSR